MFSIEINFKDGVSNSEMIIVRRPQVLIGSSESSQVIIDDMSKIGYQLKLSRDLGRKFRFKPIPLSDSVVLPKMLEGIYDGSASIDIGPVELNITALDYDLALREGEAPDRAGIRVLRQASVTPSPEYPAVALHGPQPVVVSFAPDQMIYIGRSRECALRLEVVEISAKHARMGFEGGEFWIEDLGSTNGTFINQQQISGRVNVQAGVPIMLGREVVISGITNESHLQRAGRGSSEKIIMQQTEKRYPVLISVSEVARPAKIIVPLGGEIHIGREPRSDMWLGAPHISRRHCSVVLSKTGELSVVDESTNGTAYDGGILKKGSILETKGKPQVLDFGGGVTVAVCFNEEEERAFVDSHGASKVFSHRGDSEQVNYEQSQLNLIKSGEISRRIPKNSIKSGVSKQDISPEKLLEGFKNLSFAKRFLVVLWCVAFLVVLFILGSLVIGIFA